MDAAAIDYEAFRAEVRDFALTRCPAEIRAVVATYRKLSRKIWYPWQRILFEHGWGAPSWPREFGGTGWDQRQRVIFDEVMAECDCPPQYHHGLRHLGPVIIEFGTPEQKARFLPGILNGEDWWCQGYSEPGAGSDLASLRTTARLEGDEYVVEGQKTWTSHAHESDWMYTLVRTSKEVKKQQGISLLLIPLNSPGITIRPIRKINGQTEFNQVFYDDVRIPLDNVVGGLGNGWRVSMSTLGFERGTGFIADQVKNAIEVEELIEQARSNGMIRDERIADQLAEMRAEVTALRAMTYRNISEVIRHGQPGPEASVIRVFTAELGQRIERMAVMLMGEAMIDFAYGDDNAVADYLRGFASTIAGGTAQIQRDIIGERLLGLPKSR
jgi:alkylation response protein AidB-like acyl-CoA dehydrogenase